MSFRKRIKDPDDPLIIAAAWVGAILFCAIVWGAVAFGAAAAIVWILR